MDGILLVDKPVGWTSHDVVAKVRNILRQTQRERLLGVSHLDAEQGSQEEQVSRTKGTVDEGETRADTAMRQKSASVTRSDSQQGKTMRKIRVGHTGTLDPLATGLMVLVVGNYTKRAQEFSKLDKTYEVTMKLGETSTTGDAEGNITPFPGYAPGNEVEEGLIAEVLEGFVGVSEQVPPAYSAIKVGGKRAYKLAREGKKVEMKPRIIKIYAIADVFIKYPEVKFTTKVSSGTYIRSLVEDIGKKLGTGAYMTALRRTEVGDFSIEEAVSLSSLNIRETHKQLKIVA